MWWLIFQSYMISTLPYGCNQKCQKLSNPARTNQQSPTHGRCMRFHNTRFFALARSHTQRSVLNDTEKSTECPCKMGKTGSGGTDGENSEEGSRGSGVGSSAVGAGFVDNLDWNPERRSHSFSAAAAANVGLSPAMSSSSGVGQKHCCSRS